MRLELGSGVRCADGEAGVLADLVIDPRASRVTHLVVEPRHQHALARLVPIGLAHRDGTGPDLVLGCTTRELHRLPEIRELAYRRLYDFPVRDPDWDVGVQDVLALPDGDFPGLAWNPGDGEPQLELVYDRIPKGEVEIRTASVVTSADGRRVGRVAGLVAAEDERITHLVLRRSRLRRRRELSLPIDAVERVDTDAVSLRLTKRELNRHSRSGGPGQSIVLRRRGCERELAP
jgi:sporulation protein YlmC with PRC-barrel domain